MNKNSGNWDGPLPHERAGSKIKRQIPGNPIFARHLLDFIADEKKCKQGDESFVFLRVFYRNGSAVIYTGCFFYCGTPSTRSPTLIFHPITTLKSDGK